MMVFGKLVSVVMEHVDAVGANDQHVAEAGRIIESIKNAVEKLRMSSHSIPKECKALIHLIDSMARLCETMKNWRNKTNLQKRFGISFNQGKSLALKYKETFKELFMCLDSDLKSLMLVVSVDTKDTVEEIQKDQETVKRLLEEAEQSAAVTFNNIRENNDKIDDLFEQHSEIADSINDKIEMMENRLWTAISQAGRQGAAADGTPDAAALQKIVAGAVAHGTSGIGNAVQETKVNTQALCRELSTRFAEDLPKHLEEIAENQTEDITEEIQAAIAVVMDQSAEMKGLVEAVQNRLFDKLDEFEGKLGEYIEEQGEVLGDAIKVEGKTIREAFEKKIDDEMKEIAVLLGAEDDMTVCDDIKKGLTEVIVENSETILAAMEVLHEKGWKLTQDEGQATRNEVQDQSQSIKQHLTDEVAQLKNYLMSLGPISRDDDEVKPRIIHKEPCFHEHHIIPSVIKHTMPPGSPVYKLKAKNADKFKLSGSHSEEFEVSGVIEDGDHVLTGDIILKRSASDLSDRKLHLQVSAVSSPDHLRECLPGEVEQQKPTGIIFNVGEGPEPRPTRTILTPPSSDAINVSGDTIAISYDTKAGSLIAFLKADGKSKTEVVHFAGSAVRYADFFEIVPPESEEGDYELHLLVDATSLKGRCTIRLQSENTSGKQRSATKVTVQVDESSIPEDERPTRTIVNFEKCNQGIPYGFEEPIRDIDAKSTFGVPDKGVEGTIIARLEADTKDATDFQLYGNCAATEDDQGGGKSSNFEVVNGNELILAKKFSKFSCETSLRSKGASVKKKKGIFLQVKAVNVHGTQAEATKLFIYLR